MKRMTVMLLICAIVLCGNLSAWAETTPGNPPPPPWAPAAAPPDGFGGGTPPGGGTASFEYAAATQITQGGSADRPNLRRPKRR